MTSVLWALLAAPAARADEFDAWIRLYDGLLAEAVDNDIDSANGAYSDLVRTLGGDDPLRSVALYWQGRALDSDGDVRGARDALRECVRTGYARARCLDLLGRIELEQAAVRRVPAAFDFSEPDHPFVHPWIYADKGSIRTQMGALEWRTIVDPDLDDQLLAGFADEVAAPRGVRVRLTSASAEGTLRVLMFDDSGNRFGVPEGKLDAPRGQLTTFDVPFSELVPLDGVARFDASRVDHLVLQDVSAYYGAQTGPNTWLIDEVVFY